MIEGKPFAVSDSMESCTSCTSAPQLGRWENDGKQFFVVDTPGKGQKMKLYYKIHRVWGL